MTAPTHSLAVAHTPGLPSSSPLQALADRLALPFLGPVDPRQHQAHAVLLYQGPGGLSLQQTGKGAPGPVLSDFLHGKADFRRRHGGGRGQLIARAVGLGKRKAALAVVDATAGLGQDGFVLATLGAQVLLLERSPVIAAILADGLERLGAHPDLVALRQRLQLLEVDAQTWLANQNGPVADVIHLDPMFPHRGDKAARVKKEMTAFQGLVGSDDDAPELLRQALAKARFRVAVKRPRKAPAIAGPTPDLVLEGKSTRYDVYIIAAITEPQSQS